MADFETAVTLGCPLHEAFDFFIQPKNIIQLSPPNMGLQFTQAPEKFSEGSRLDLRIQVYGQVYSATHVVKNFRPQQGFTEEQVSGLFETWVHEHQFSQNAAGQVEVIDRITFTPPQGLLGKIVFTRSRIEEYLEEGFYQRHEKLRKFLPVLSSS